MRPLDPRVLPHLQPARGSLIIVVAAQVLTGMAVIAQAFVLGAFVVALVEGRPWRDLVWWLFAVLSLRALSSALADYFASAAAGKVSRTLRHLVMARALQQGHLPEPHGLPTGGSVGQLGLLITRGVNAIQPYVSRYLPALVVATAVPVLTVLAISTQDWLSAAIVVCTLPLVPIFAILIGLATQEKADRQWRTLARLSGHFLDVVRGLKTLIVFRRAQVQSGKIREVTDAYRRATLETLKVAFISSAALELIATISVALVAVTVGLRLVHGGIDFETALVVLLLAPEAYWPLRRVGAEFHAAAEGTATFEEIHELLRPATETEERFAAGPLAASSSSRSGAGSAGELGAAPSEDLVLDRVSVSYGEHEVFRNLSFRFPARGLCAISGPSGCGKSTLLRAMLGEVALTAGQIRPSQNSTDQNTSGQNTTGRNPLSPPTWRDQIAYLPQTPWIFSGTIADNVRLARPDAGNSDVRSALDTVDVDFDLDYRVTEDGANLSAGQRARVGMARVLLSDRPWVFLDEPTAHLDQETESILVRTMRQLARKRGVIVVAHRKAVVEIADTQLTLPAGGGRHQTNTNTDTKTELPFPTESNTSGASRAAAASPQPPSAQPVEGLRGKSVTTSPYRALLGAFLSTMASGFGVALTATAGWLIARAAEEPPVLYLMVAIVAVRLFGLGRPAWRYLERIATHDDALRLLAERRARVYDMLIPLIPARVGRQRGDLLSSIVDDVDAFVDHQLRVRLPIYAALGTSVIATAVAWVVLPTAGATIAAFTALAGVLGWLVSSGVGRRQVEGLIGARSRIFDVTIESLHHASSVTLWKAERGVLANLDDAGTVEAQAVRRTTAGLALGHGLVYVGAATALAALAWITSADASVSGPMTALLLMLPIALIDVVSGVVDAGSLSASTRAARERIDALARLEPAVRDPADSLILGEEPTVRLSEVAIAWQHEPVVQGLNLSLPPGKRIGVVGPSGSGKSTLSALLLRLLAPRSGVHQLDEEDIANYSGNEVRGSVGLVDDAPYLFSSTVIENVRLARPEADELAILEALDKVQLTGWLSQLPQGLDTLIGEGGLDVSGGERARLGLARAILADPAVLVLDEPTAHLDSSTAEAVSRQVVEAGVSRSLVWITHTQVGLDQMDEVLRLKDDRDDHRAPSVL